MKKAGVLGILPFSFIAMGSSIYLIPNSFLATTTR